MVAPCKQDSLHTTNNERLQRLNESLYLPTRIEDVRASPRGMTSCVVTHATHLDLKIPQQKLGQ